MKKEKLKCIAGASFTVETSFLFLFILTAVFLVISYGFFVHQKVYFTAAAFVSAMSGEDTKAKAEQFVDEAVISIYLPEVSVSEDTGKIGVTYEGEILTLMGNHIFSYTSTGEKKYVDPVKHIRNVRLALEIKEAVTDE